MPTFSPTAAQLGLDGGEIVWAESEIRTFCYAPWNFKRQCFDTDRCGIEKGSVFVVKFDSKDKLPEAFVSRYVGSYRNEGFGRVIYNPAFLEAYPDGKAKYSLDNDWKAKANSAPGDKQADGGKQAPGDKQADGGKLSGGAKGYSSVLVEYLKERKANERDIYKAVNEWIVANQSRFKGDSFASQWGTIRSLATSITDFEALKKALYDGKDGYLTHGVAKEKWADRGRLEAFKEFVEGFKREPEFARHAIVNLAAEMAKRCKED